MLGAPLLAALFACASCGLGRALVAFQLDDAGDEVRLERRLQELWFETLDRSPELATRAGISKDTTRWDPLAGSAAALESAALVEAAIARLADDFTPRDVGERGARLLSRGRTELVRQREQLTGDALPTPHPWRGVATTAPTFLARLQPGADVEDLQAWIGRLESLAEVVREESRRARAGGGAAGLPRALLDRTLDVLRPLAGSTSDGAHPLLTPFERRADALPQASAEALQRQARAVVRDLVRPAYAELVDVLEGARSRATEVSGAGRSPELIARWRETLAALAGPDREPLVLHDLGRAQVSRLHEELRAIAPSDSTLERWFDELRAAGAARAPRPAPALWADVLVGLPQLVGDVRVAAPEVRRAERWEATLARSRPLVPASHDGRRRARFVVLPAALDTAPAWWREFESLRHGLPGRALYEHLVSRADVPDLLAHASHPAHAEGWSLWVALAALDEGLVTPGDRGFMRLAVELVHASALVADTGLHGRGWTLGQAVDYLRGATPLPVAECETLALRIAAEPGLAAAPFLGLVQLRSLERQAELALGPYLDRPAFRRAVLDEGALGPDDLEERVARWLRAQVAER